MSGLVNKIKEFVGIPVELDDEEGMWEELNEASGYDEPEEMTHDNPIKNRRNGLTVVQPINAKATYEVMVVEPRTFEESLEVVNNLRTRKSIVLNLHLLDAEQSQRVVDFISGATHALDGHQQRIGEGVFIFTPNNVNISVETEKTRLIRDAFWNQA